MQKKRLIDKTKRFAKVIGVNPNSITVKDYKSRWGSCSVQGDISYNWRIILAPHSIVDYVVVHELCHMLEHNHSSKYWKHVERYMPNWRECKDWLKQNQLAKDL
jgi:predicted metal-dependent hydrolase